MCDHSNTSVHRTIQVVQDHRSSPGGLFRSASDVLDDLDASGLACLRRELTEAWTNGHALFTCGMCRQPVYIAVRGHLDTGYAGGRRAFFVHRSSLEAEECSWFGGQGDHPDLIDGRRFEGRQEGARHNFLKHALADALRQDTSGTFSDVRVEAVISEGGTWRRPDVMAWVGGRRIAFDVQLAPPLVTTVVARERFYAEHCIAYLWVVDGAALDRLVLQGFQDVVWPQGGIVMGFDEDGASTSQVTGHLSMKRCRLHQDPGTERINVKADVVSTNQCLAAAGLAQSGGCIATSLRESWFLEVLRRGDAAQLQRAYDLYAEMWGLPGLQQARRDRLFECVGVLATAMTGRKSFATGFGATAIPAILNWFLENARTRPWSRMVEAVADVHPAARRRIEAKPSTRQKMSRNLAEIDADPDRSRHLETAYDGLFRRLFPGVWPRPASA